MAHKTDDGEIEYASKGSRGEYRIFKGGRWSSWIQVSGGLQEAAEAAQKAQDTYLKSKRRK